VLGNVLLIHPCLDRQQQYGDLADLVWSEVPLSLGFLAAYLVERGVEVKIVDEQWGRLDDERIAELVRTFQPRLVGITTLTPVLHRSFELAEGFKRASAEVAVVLGNVHPTIRPDESLSHPAVDLVVRGEGEVALWECLQHVQGEMDAAEIPGLSYRRNGEIVHNPDRPYEKDLDVFPRCAYELLRENMPAGVAPALLLTSRGCPYRCIFCSSRLVSGHAYRVHSPERVVEDVEYLLHQYGLPNMLVVDDNFLVGRRRIEEICGLFVERGIHERITWSCQARADAIDERVLEIMRGAGCIAISFGIECGSQRLLDLIGKHQSLEANTRAVKLAHRAGLRTRGSFILGLPTETAEESRETIRFAKTLPLDVAKFALATPYPGTDLYEIAVEEGLDVGGDWSRMSSMVMGMEGAEPSYVPRGRTAKELERAQTRAHLEFYLRPRQLWAILRGRNPELRIRSFGHLLRMARAALRLLGKLALGRRRGS